MAGKPVPKKVYFDLFNINGWVPANSYGWVPADFAAATNLAAANSASSSSSSSSSATLSNSAVPASVSALNRQLECREDIACMNVLTLRFPTHTNNQLNETFVMKRATYPDSKLGAAIQYVENMMHSPNAVDLIDDVCEFEWYWRRKGDLSIGQKFDLLSANMLEETYRIHADNTSCVNIEGYQMNFFAMEMVHPEQIYLTRLKVQSHSTAAALSQQPVVDLSAVDIPTTWEPQEVNKQSFEVHLGSEEWANVTNRFKESLPHIHITQIQRMQNGLLWKKYFYQRNIMEEKNGKANTNELALFHGTRKIDPTKIWKGDHGFDMRFCIAGIFGLGSYFAHDSAYSYNYSYKLPESQSGEHQMFLARVLTGHSVRLTQSLQSKQLRMPPARMKSLDGIDMLYDSVHGLQANRLIYVLYELHLAYPEYLITFVKR